MNIDNDELRQKLLSIGYVYSDGTYGYIVSDLEKLILSLLATQRQALRDEAMAKLDQSYNRSGKGSRPKFSRDTETSGEYYSRTQGFKSGILTAKQAISTIFEGKK